LGKDRLFFRTARNISGNLEGSSGGIFHLLGEERRQISRVEVVSHLVSGAAEADVLQGSSLTVGVNPERENTLVSFPELASSGQHAATIDEDREVKGNPVFQSYDLGREL
jgi:hypothetical protein